MNEDIFLTPVLNRANRKWSVEEDDLVVPHDISVEGMKYLLASLEEFKKVREEKNPEKVVEETVKFLQ